MLDVYTLDELCTNLTIYWVTALGDLGRAVLLRQRALGADETTP